MRAAAGPFLFCIAVASAQENEHELFAMEHPSLQVLRRAVSSEDPGLARAAAKILVHEHVDLSDELLVDLMADELSRPVLLSALADRPRRAPAVWLQKALPGLNLELAERLQAFVVLAPGELSKEQAREILDGAVDEDGWVRSLAFAAADRMSATQADLLVADVHKRSLTGITLELLLPCMSRMSVRGERHLIGLARSLNQDQRNEIADWLGMRSSTVLHEYVLDGLRGAFLLQPMTLRMLDGPIDVEDRARILALLEDDRPPMRRAAFRVLCVGGQYDPVLLDYALAEPEEAEGRLRDLLELELPEIAVLKLLRSEDEHVLQMTLRSMAGEQLRGAVEARVLALAEKDGDIGNAAARQILATGRPVSVRRLWTRLDEDRRRSECWELRQREAWALPLVQDLDLGLRDWDIRYTRIALGDEQEFRELLERFTMWPESWLRRLEPILIKRVSAEDMPEIESCLTLYRNFTASDFHAQLDSERKLRHREVLCGVLAARPDLGGDELLLAIYRDGEEESLRSEALLGLLRRPATRAEIYSQLNDWIGKRPGDKEEDLAYEVAGNMQAPLDVDEASLLARLLLVAPLGEAAESEPGPPNMTMINIAGRILRSGVSDEVVAAFVAAAEEAKLHPKRAQLDDRRLVSLLVALCFNDEVRLALGSVIGELIASRSGVEPRYLGPALLMMADGWAREGDWSRAADAYRRAAPMMLRHPLEPLQMRTLLGDNYPGVQLALGSVYARSHLCQVRAFLQAEDRAKAEAALRQAKIFSYGDQAAEAELGVLIEELQR